MGRMMSREVCYYNADGSHHPLVMHATMSFIRYRGKLTREWSNLRPGRKLSSSTTGGFDTPIEVPFTISLTNLHPEVPLKACIKPFGMTGFDLYRHSSFRKPNENLHLPSRLVWRTTYG
ncbi:unnamed protein product [Rhizoctonia solani]|nr:unnamed protein product [Rhizoctonia solani]